MALAPERLKLQGLMAKTTADQARYRNWNYRAVRPQYIPSTYWAGGHVEADCSDGCRMLCRWANLPDPAGNSYSSYGNSSSIWAHLPHISVSEAQPGDIGTFGYRFGEKHAFMFWEKYGTGTYDWYVWNMGAQGQPAKRTLWQEIWAHSGMALIVGQIPVTDPPPTPQDKLRAMTGFYAWVSWRLGEGPFKKYGKRNQKVRPNVPRLIGFKWWSRLARFKANRKKANR